MKKIIVFVLLLLLGLVFSSSASKSNSNSNSNSEKLPGIDIPLSEMNSKIRLEPYPGMPQVHKNKETLGFLIRNKSSSTISFGKDFGIKVFKKQGAAWILAENINGYPEGENILPTTKQSPVGLSFFVTPYLEGLNESTNVRIVVIGYVTNKPTEQVGGYIDVLYEP